MDKKIFITGATGFLGAGILKELVINRRKYSISKIFALVRHNSSAEASARLKKQWWESPDLQILGNALDKGLIKAISGDISSKNLGIKNGLYKSLIKEVTHVIHAAALTRMDLAKSQYMRVNFDGTLNVIDFCRDIKRDGNFKRLSYISTAYICGRKNAAFDTGNIFGAKRKKNQNKECPDTEEIKENFYRNLKEFNNNYELSKYLAEKEVFSAQSELPVTIFRPSMIIGDSISGRIKTFNTIFYPLKIYLSGKAFLIPLNPSILLDFVPVDFVASSISELTFKKKSEGRFYHLTAPEDKKPSLGQFIGFVRSWAIEELGIKPPAIIQLNINPGTIMRLLRLLIKIAPVLAKNKKISNFYLILPYLFSDFVFSRSNTVKDCKKWDYDWKKLVKKNLSYAVSKGFLHNTGRTVHEQILFRLSSSRRPIRYFDISGKKIQKYNNVHILETIKYLKAAIEKAGIAKGDKIALLGYNSTKYFIADTAAGLVGAVTVPLYYTSSAAQVEELLKESEAKMIFIGCKEFFGKIKHLHNIKVVSMCKSSNALEESPGVIKWLDFLQSGKKIIQDDLLTGLDNKIQAISARDSNDLIMPSDIATIRYSSGTTGAPKGVVFNHFSLRWMAETVNSLFPWSSRIKKVYYLSFLPLNHVVEGILANYSHYYTPAAADIFFLENFRDLVKALRVVRPTVFFSVPRFYEKIYENFNARRFVRQYFKYGSIFQKFLKPVIRKIILLFTGLERCGQLIAGSAPLDINLLKWFSEFGIDIYNAYGLTEAPLISFSRFGKNMPGAAGQPLPETKISIAKDGEIIVSGPQVAIGYWKKKGCIEKIGRLHTGDIGAFKNIKDGKTVAEDDDFIIIKDRKKDIIITSYGKNISPLKIEFLLKKIEVVDEAMVGGNNRPYCIALLWTSVNQIEHSSFMNLQQELEIINSGLSSAEKIKRWVLLYNRLADIAGLLTPNLKLIRKAIESYYMNLISALYSFNDCHSIKIINELNEKRDNSSLAAFEEISSSIENPALRASSLIKEIDDKGVLFFGCTAREDGK